MAIRRDIYVGESRADVEATAGPVLARGYRGFDPAALVTGTIDEVVGSFRDLGAMGYTDVIVRHLMTTSPRFSTRFGVSRRSASLLEPDDYIAYRKGGAGARGIIQKWSS